MKTSQDFASCGKESRAGAAPAFTCGMQAAARLIALLALPLFLSGCVLTMPKPFLKQRQVENAGLPDLKGRWSDQEGEKLTLTPVKGVNNTYSAVSDRGKETILLTVERLDQTRFVAQAAFAGSPGVLLTVAEISDRKVLVYLFPDSLEEMRKIGKENGVTITDKGLITKYENAQGIIAFFRRLASLPGRKDMEFTKN